MENTNVSRVRRFLKILMWTFLVLACIYLVAGISSVVYLFIKSGNDAKTEAEVEKIHNTKLTLDDVMGKNLPPDPGVLADKTIAGVDANNNGIRDDVELAIFNTYPNSAKTRAVLLQYALALQMEFTQPIIDTTTATEIVREQSRAFECIGDIVSRANLEKFNEEADSLTNFVKNRQFNTTERQNARNVFLDKVGSYSGLNKICDIDYSKLLN